MIHHGHYRVRLIVGRKRTLAWGDILCSASASCARMERRSGVREPRWRVSWSRLSRQPSSNLLEGWRPSAQLGTLEPVWSSVSTERPHRPLTMAKLG